MESLKDKVAVVTGAGSGIGRQTSIALAKYGAKVVVSDINLEGANETVKLILSQNPESLTLAVKCDVSSNESVAALIAKVVEKFGRLDLAVNNAGIPGKLAAIADTTEENFDHVIAVHLKGVFLCLKHEITQMQKQEKGLYSIVNMSSMAGLLSFSFNAPYSAAKHGILGLTKTVAVEYSKAGIRVNAVCPAPIDTNMFHSYFDAALEEKFIGMVPMGRIGTPDEVASTVLWLLSTASSFTTGIEVPVAGGFAV